MHTVVEKGDEKASVMQQKNGEETASLAVK
jgi:hypothetical protein